jgi:hypothetical protein
VGGRRGIPGAWVSGEGVERRSRAGITTQEGKIFFFSLLERFRDAPRDRGEGAHLVAPRVEVVPRRVRDPVREHAPSRARRVLVEPRGRRGEGLGAVQRVHHARPERGGGEGGGARVGARMAHRARLVGASEGRRRRSDGTRGPGARVSAETRARGRARRGVRAACRAVCAPAPRQFPCLVSEHATRRGRERGGVAVGRIAPKRSRPTGGRASMHPRWMYVRVATSREPSIFPSRTPTTLYARVV